MRITSGWLEVMGVRSHDRRSGREGERGPHGQRAGALSIQPADGRCPQHHNVGVGARARHGMRYSRFTGSDDIMLSGRSFPVARAGRRHQLGLSLVEMMVGIAVGLFVVAAAATVVATQLAENRRLMLETQLNQDLRAAMDIVTREIRRAGYIANSTSLVWSESAPNPAANANLSFVPDTASPTTSLQFSYERAPTRSGPFGFQYDGASKLSSRLLFGGGWQELTDSTTMTVESFVITPRHETSTPLPCPKLCPGGLTTCWPTVTVREYLVELTGRARSDSTVRRSLQSAVRVRNSGVKFNGGADVCPA